MRRASAKGKDEALAEGVRISQGMLVAVSERVQGAQVSAPLGVTYEVAKLPYAVLIDGAGILRAKGLVNTREHLDSLFEAKERGVASIQDFLQAAEDDMRAAGS